MPDPVRIVGAQAYLQHCLGNGLPFAIVTGGPDSGKPMLVRRLLADPLVGHAAHLASATGDAHAFLERVLEQLGFEPFESSCEELQKLLTVFARHEAAQGRRTVIALEEAQEFGARVLSMVKDMVLADKQAEAAPITFLLTGTPALVRVLDSEGMRNLNGMTRWRFSLDDDTDDGIPRPAVEVNLQGKVVDRRVLDQPRLMIGRHAQNDLSLDNNYVSRHHALLVSREDAVYVVDLQSTNGTFVNGQQVQRHALKDGDVIQIGYFRLRYCQPVGAQRPIQDEDPSHHADTDVLGLEAVAS